MWPRHMQSDCVTQVSICHGTQGCINLAAAMEFLTALQKQCVMYSCALSINGQMKPSGIIEYTLHTLLLKDQVSALVANYQYDFQGYTVAVETVVPQALGNTNAVMQQLRSLRVNHGH